MFWQILAKKESKMEWIDKVINAVALFVIVAGSIVLVIAREDWIHKK